MKQRLLSSSRNKRLHDGIRTVETEISESGIIEKVRLVFGPHYFVNLVSDKEGRVHFSVGATHHGFGADASEVNGELDRLIFEIRDTHPRNKVD